MLGIAVIGCGRIGQMHARNLARHPRVKLMSVYDVATALAQKTAQELNVKAARSVDEVLAEDGVRAVLIASSTATHVPILTAAVKAGKAVLCEKPIDLDLERAEACWQEICPYQPVVMLGFNRRFDPSFRALRERLRAGEIGKPELVVITSRDPSPAPAEYIRGSGGLFKDMTIHDFDMARYLVGDIVEAEALGATLVDPAITALGDIDTCVISLRSASGALVQINNSRRCAYGYDQRIEVFGAEGMLQAGNRLATSIEHWGRQGTGKRDVLPDFFIERYREAYGIEVDAFVTCLEEGAPVFPDFADGLAALRLAVAAEQSLRHRRAVEI
jgi:myo-inositol 2-dehydrogenase/D-chiro-inositol 1-dehydrogenase